MGRKYLLMLMSVILFCTTSDAQVFIGGRAGRPAKYGRPRHREKIQPYLPQFHPSLNISMGYGFPNLDKDQLPGYYDFYKGAASQKGPVTGSIDYQFNRRMSIGLLVTHGTVTMPYYDYTNSTEAAMNGRLDNWSYMLNFVRYIPAGKNVTPYLRTAIGINSWEQDFTDASGNKINPPVVLSDFAYQVGLGARFTISKNAGMFVEAGYGKYILHGGLSFKF